MIRAKAAPQTGAKILGKIDLGEEKPKEVEEAPKPEPVKEPAKPVVENRGASGAGIQSFGENRFISNQIRQT